MRDGCRTFWGCPSLTHTSFRSSTMAISFSSSSSSIAAMDYLRIPRRAFFDPTTAQPSNLQRPLTSMFFCSSIHYRRRSTTTLLLHEPSSNHEPSNISRSKVPRRNMMTLMPSSFLFSQLALQQASRAEQSVGFREYMDTFDGYTFTYPQNWIPVRGAGADIFFRDPFVLDENLSVELSSPSSSQYKSVEDLGPPEMAGQKVLKQYLTEFMSTRLGVRRESSILSTSSRVADDGKLYYQVEVNIKSYANNNELAVMPQDRITRLEWDRRYLSVLGVENNRLYELRLQTPESVFMEEEGDLRRVMDSFRVFRAAN